MTSIYGVHGYEHASVPYLSDRWIMLLHHAATEARRLGMGLDTPPGSGWRLGGPGVRVDSQFGTMVTAPSGLGLRQCQPKRGVTPARHERDSLRSADPQKRSAAPRYYAHTPLLVERVDRRVSRLYERPWPFAAIRW